MTWELQPRMVTRVGVRVLVVLSIERMPGEELAGSRKRSFISKAVSFLCASLCAFISVTKLGVLVGLSLTSHRATQPFARNNY